MKISSADLSYIHVFFILVILVKVKGKNYKLKSLLAFWQSKSILNSQLSILNSQLSTLNSQLSIPNGPAHPFSF